MRSRRPLTVAFALAVSLGWRSPMRAAEPFLGTEALLKSVQDKKHPYLLFTRWEDTPGFRHRAEPPYGGHVQWLFYVKTEADRVGGMFAAFHCQVSQDRAYAEKAKDALRKVEPLQGDRIRTAADSLIRCALAYDWVRRTLSPEEDGEIRAKLAALADSVYQKYPGQDNAHDRIMGASGLGVMACALADYAPKTPSKPADWLRDATVSLFVKDRFRFPAAYAQDPVERKA